VQRFWASVDEQSGPVTRPGIAAAIASAGVAVGTTAAIDRLLSVELPFLFCIGAVAAIAIRGGLLLAAVTTVVALTGTASITDDPALVNLRSLAVVTAFCLCLGLCGEILLHLRHRERSATARALRRERILQLMFDRSPAVTLLVDSDGQIVAANEAARGLLPFPSKDAVEGHIDDYVPLGRNSADAQPLHLEDGKTLQLRVTEVPVELNARVVRMIYVRDDTEVARAAEELAIAQRGLHQIARATSLGQFGSSIAHELNQPLAFVANYVGAALVLLRQGSPNDDRVTAALEDALTHVFRASAVLKQLRMFVGRRAPALSWQHASDLLSEAVRLGELAIRQADATLTVAFDVAGREVLADAVQLQQVVTNLLVNAAEAVIWRERREVAIRAWQDAPDSLTVVVEDSGSGLAPDEREDVFTPFRSTKADGVGIGLAICRTIVKHHGGSIWCDADTPLGGARFAFTLSSRAAERLTNAA